MCEVYVLDGLLARALDDNRKKTDLLRQFAFVLKVPRMHHEYIERNGIDPFIERFTKLISENQALKDEMIRLGEARRVRRAVSLVKHGTRVAKQTKLTNELPNQIDLLISQRSAFLGKALDEFKVNLKGQEKTTKREHAADRVISLSSLN